MQDLGWVGLRVKPVLTHFRSELESGTSRDAASAGSKAGRSFGTRMSTGIHDHLRETAKYVVAPLLGAFALEKIGSLIGESITAASDLAAAQARSRLIFGKSAEDVSKFGERAAKSLGLAQNAALLAAAGFGAIGQRAGLSEQQNAKASERLIKRAIDLAALTHTAPSAAITAFQRGVAGATRGLKPYGILIDSTSVKAEALAAGLLKPVKDSAQIHAAQVRVLSDQRAYTQAVTDHGKASLEAQKASASLGTAQDSLNKVTAGAVPQMTQQQKILASTKLIMAQSSIAAGTFHKHQGDLFEQQQKLNASWSNAKDRLGKGLMPVETDLVKLINRQVLPAVDRFAGWFQRKGGPAIHGFEQDLKPLVKTALPALGTGLEDAYKAGKALLPVAKGIFGEFNKLPGPVKEAIVVGGGSAYLAYRSRNTLLGKALLGGGKAAGKYLGLGGGAAAKTVLGEAASLTHPVPVFVTNEGFGGKLGGLGLGTAAADAAGAEGAAAAAGLSASEIAAVALPIALSLYGAYLVNQEPSLYPKAPPGTTADVARGGPAASRHYGGPTAGQGRDESYGSATGTSPYVARGGRAAQQFYADQAKARDSMKATGTRVDALRTELGNASRSLDLVGSSAARNFAMAQGLTGKYATALSRLPVKVQTAILTPGLVNTQTDVEHLQRQYDLTPRQISTLFTVLGIDKARGEITGMLGLYHGSVRATGGRTTLDPSSNTGGHMHSGSGGGGAGRPSKVRGNITIDGPDGPSRGTLELQADHNWQAATNP